MCLTRKLVPIYNRYILFKWGKEKEVEYSYKLKTLKIVKILRYTIKKESNKQMRANAMCISCIYLIIIII